MEQAIEKNKDRIEVLPLYWLDRLTGLRQKAGVAFYEEKYGEYRLKVDFLTMLSERPPCIYLRPISAGEDEIEFIAEAVIRTNQSTLTRKPIGEGYASLASNNDIHLKLGPFENVLVVSFDKPLKLIKNTS